MATVLYLLMLLVAVPANAAPSGPPDFLDGIDDFLAAFGGLALSGDPLAEAEQEEPAAEPAEQPAVVTEVAPCLGCVQVITADSAALRETAALAAYLLEEKLNSSAALAAIQVYAATRQVVNGIMYQLTLEVAETNCSREEPLAVEESCLPAEDAERRFFDLTLLVQPHRNHSELTQVEDAAWVLASFEATGGSPGLFTGSEPPSSSDLADAPQSQPDGVFPGGNSEVFLVPSQSEPEEVSPGEQAASEPDLSELFGIM